MQHNTSKKMGNICEGIQKRTAKITWSQ